MAECSYARCVQQRRNVRRLLQRWTKNMVHIVGLERIAEELMGRRKWKLYQDSMSRSYLQPLNNNVARAGSPAAAAAGDAPKPGKQQQQQPAAAVAAGTAAEGAAAGEPEAAAAAPASDGASAGGGPAAAAAPDPLRRQEDEEGRLPRDWQPPPARCHFCADGKLDAEHAVHGVLSPRQSDSDTSDSQSDGEAPASLTAAAAAAVGNGRAHTRPCAAMAALDDVSAAALAVAALSGGGASAAAAAAGAPHLGFYAPGVSNWYFANVAFQNASDVDKAGGEQPLDLSKGSSNSSSSSEPKIAVGNNLNVRLPGLDARSIFSSDFRAKPRMPAVAGRRTYTEDELQAALRDIQSGKLGTRRAAVIYGIPRSTLRNKVYKLTMERDRESHLNSSGLKDDDPMDDDKDLSGAEEEKEVEKVLQAPLLSVADILSFPTEHPSDVIRNLMQLRPKEGQEMWTGLDHTEVAPYIHALLASQSLLVNQKPEGVINNILPELAKRIMAEEQHLKTQNNGDSEKLSRPSPSNSVITKVEKARSESDMDTDESPSNVILKIPSFKPTTSGNKNGCDIFRNVEASRLVSPPVTTNTSDSGSPPILPGKGLLIKDAIAQSISQKFQQTLEPVRRPIMEMDLKRGGFTPPLGAAMSVIKTQQPTEVQRPQYQPPPKPQQTGSGTTGGKGTRPKRGKYRNYDRDSLVEAVRAVQRGEMSVHRAGSYYGVPHSTLEYKVKERHLMRPRKRDPKPNPVDEKIASLKQNDLRAATQDKLKPNIMKPPQKFSPTSPNGIKLPMPGMASLTGYNPPPFPFWPHPAFHHMQMEYAARNPTAPFPPNHEFFASQMMQKIQEESSRTIAPQGAAAPSNSATLATSARQMAESLLDGSGTNGSFLDGIIRSSLESGIPTSEEKSPREEKNLAPENMSNKALLDQLCRNSRLTPLSKPPLAAVDPNSSGDESYRKGSSPLNFTTSNNSNYQEESSETSTSGRPQKETKGNNVQTIELSNDSNDTDKKVSIDAGEHKHPRIYLKPDLVKPENLKPEMLVRFQGVNGATECATGSSASDNDAPQD